MKALYKIGQVESTMQRKLPKKASKIFSTKDRSNYKTAQARAQQSHAQTSRYQLDEHHIQHNYCLLSAIESEDQDTV